MGNDASSLKDKLYQRVSDQLLETDKKYAANITGMLLEMDSPLLEDLLKSEDLLQSAVHTALQAYLKTVADGKEQPGHIDCDTDNDGLVDNNWGDSQRDLLYKKVEEVHPDQAAKITGMLLEQEVIDIETLLNDDQTLQQCIQRAYSACYQRAGADGDNIEQPGLTDTDNGRLVDNNLEDSQRDLLYEKVERVHPENAAKITGMLLEQDVIDIEMLLNDDQALQRCIHRAKSVCYQRAGADIDDIEQTGPIDCDTDNDRLVGNNFEDSRGDLLYERVEKVQPENAAKITGMLLEQDVVDIETLLNDDQTLQSCIQRAYSVLEVNR